MKLNASHLTRPKAGETRNGDAVVLRQAGARALVAVVDALGHGPAAEEVALAACRHLESVSLELDLKRIVEGLHASLRNTRGAAAMVCALDGHRLDGCGVGNVDLRVQGGSVPIVLSPGVLGTSVRQLRVFSGEIHAGDRLVLFSDGISSRFSLDRVRRLSPAEACGQILAQHGHSHDDATVLIADLAI
jgi:phosphoserine phosphatase RsbX